jgi:hypothetical protein
MTVFGPIQRPRPDNLSNRKGYDMKHFIVLGLACLALTACSPQKVVDKVVARTAETVISPVTGPDVARCVVDHADPSELEVLARDVGVRAGTRTVAIIQGILNRPDTQKCLTRANLTAPVLS